MIKQSERVGFIPSYFIILMEKIIRHLFRQLSPEKAHHLMIRVAKLAPGSSRILKRINYSNNNNQEYFNFIINNHKQTIKWYNPLGLAAGYDKNAEILPFLQHLGFGAIECGTVTRYPQLGNPLPRIFRVKEKGLLSLRNSMGFPNCGWSDFKENIGQYQHSASQVNSATQPISLGINFGPNKEIPFSQIIDDLAFLYQESSIISHYQVLNISSPNTQGLRNLQAQEYLKKILENLPLKNENNLLIKISPDLEQKQVWEIAELIKEFNLAGIIATNTTAAHQLGAGGLSGDHLRLAAKKIRSWALKALQEDSSKIVIASGGISSAEDYLEFFKQGGLFAQIYTALIYQGPTLLGSILKQVSKEATHQGHNSLMSWHHEIISTKKTISTKDY